MEIAGQLIKEMCDDKIALLLDWYRTFETEALQETHDAYLNGDTDMIKTKLEQHRVYSDVLKALRTEALFRYKEGGFKYYVEM